MSDSFDELVETRPDSTPGGDRPEAAPPGRRDDLILSGPGGEPPEEGPAPPVRVGPFRVVSVLGAGAMGVVYRARHESSGREVALKLLKETANPNRLERIRREGELTARLKHPNVVAIHSAGDVDGQPWLAYELVEDCRTLQEVFPGLELGERVELLRDAARALGHAHALGICHRDVKPDNLLVDGSGRLRVADFGLAGAGDLERLTRSGDLIGTPLFMAPEQISGKRAEVGPGVDVWALGVILYELLCGRLPYQAATLVELVVRINRGRPRPPSAYAADVPFELEAVCRKALATDPRDRYADGAALADDLDRWLRGEPVAASGEVGGRAWLALVVALVVVLLGAAILFARGGGPSDEPSDPGPRRADELQRAPEPRLILDAPAPHAHTQAETIRVRGRVEVGGSWAQVVVGGRIRRRVQAGAPFSLRFPLRPGRNELVVDVVDAEGRGGKPVRRVVWRVPAWYARKPPGRRAPLPLPAGVRFEEEGGEFVNERDGSVLVWVWPPRVEEGHMFGVGNLQVRFSQGYFIGKYEVTWAQYRRFCAETQRAPPQPAFAVTPRHPVHWVNWEDAHAYCAWAGLRLPTEAEWAYAARGGDGRKYAWGNERRGTSALANLKDEGDHRDPYKYTAPVGSFPRGVSPFGCHDMGGNLFEWVFDWYAKFPRRAPPRVDPQGPDRGTKRVTKGSGYDNPPLSIDSRFPDDPSRKMAHKGFRVARSAR